MNRISDISNQFRLVVEAAPQAMIIVDDRGLMVYVNAQVEKQFGYHRDEMQQQSVDILIPEDVRGHHPQLREKYMRQSSTRAMGAGRDLYGQAKDGRKFPVEVGLNPLETPEGRFVIVSIIDISERKRQQAALEQQFQETQRALQRLKDTQAQLVQSERLASLGGLVAGVAHEVNTPLGIGVTAASFLSEQISKIDRAMQEGKLTKSSFGDFIKNARESADILSTNLRRAAELIQSFKKIAVDQSSEEHQQIEISKYIDEVLLSLKPKLKCTQLQLVVDCPDKIEVETVPGALSQILTNLVMNSLVHAYDEGEAGTIIIRAHKSEDGQVVLSYIDDGKGIPKAYLSKVFDPFFTTKRANGGSGLGLHIVFSLVHQVLGGTIEIESEEGKGAQFTITLPCLPPAEHEALGER
ncbi:PAS domain-containing sensor histidine kinase [Spongiibacter sp. KMU-158]|uniref:histidine kinase n=1 Tax=Spongiibacter pelagi TaxID=2760804 RepID=A0A927BZC3_9GAMM|nr:PAS domain-containing sensor histidine kinase [Spongiibacter pelagi]MBD2858373.1 PAS domain-containing sensor histidine kinase [Spongiibacter pelagi]